MITTIESIHGMNLNDDTLDLIEYIKQMISHTEFENFNIFSFSIRKEINDSQLYNTLQVIEQTDELDAIIDIEEPVKILENNNSELIEYNYGLNKFDNRLFNAHLFEDFNDKVTTICEEDLYLIYATFLSYFYKLTNNIWEEEKIDPYIIENMLTILYNEIQNRYKDYDNWFNEWNIYFSDENIEKYLDERNKEKDKKIIM